MANKILYSTKYLDLKEISNENYKYFYIEQRPSSKAISILPYIPVSGGDYKFVIRDNIIPPWNTEISHITSITGTCEINETPLQTAQRELLEEGGLDLPEENIIGLDWLWVSKAENTKMFFFAVEVNDVKDLEPEGDGTYLENIANIKKVTKKTLLDSKDPTLFINYYKLINYLS